MSELGSREAAIVGREEVLSRQLAESEAARQKLYQECGQIRSEGGREGRKEGGEGGNKVGRKQIKGGGEEGEQVRERGSLVLLVTPLLQGERQS